MKLKALPIMLAAFLASSGISAQKYLWNSQFGTSGVAVKTKDAAIDANNNVYLTGFFTAPQMTIGDKEITGSSPVMDAYVTKFSKNNSCVFAQSLKSSGAVYVQSIAADKDGNTYVCGMFEFDMTVSDAITLSSDYQDFFIVKYDASGSAVWARSSDSAMGPTANSIATDKDNNIIISGTFSGSLNLDLNGGTKEISAGDSQSAFFVAKYAPNGDIIWAEASTKDGSANGKRMATDELGNIYIAGDFSGEVAFENNTITAVSSENNDNFIVKYTPTGKVEWLRSITGTKVDNIADLDVANGRVAISGVIRSLDMKIDNEPSLTIACNDESPEKNNYNILVLSFTTDGKYEWNYVGGGQLQPSEAYTVSIDKDGSVWNAGVASGSYNFNPSAEDESMLFPSKAKGGRDMYLVKLSSKGQVLIGHRVGAATSEEAADILVGEDGLLYLTDLISLRSGTATPVGLYGDPIATIVPMSKALSVALVCYQQLYASPAVLPEVKPGSNLDISVEAEKANGDVVYSVLYGQIPAGFNFDVNTGKLTGSSSIEGTYSFVIRMQDADGNVGFADYKLTVSKGTGINDIEAETINIWGSKGIVNINADSQNQTVEIYDITGKKVLSTIQNGQAEYPLAAGAYIVNVKTITGNSVVRKVLVF